MTDTLYDENGLQDDYLDTADPDEMPVRNSFFTPFWLIVVFGLLILSALLLFINGKEESEPEPKANDKSFVQSEQKLLENPRSLIESPDNFVARCFKEEFYKVSLTNLASSEKNYLVAVEIVGSNSLETYPATVNISNLQPGEVRIIEPSAEQLPAKQAGCSIKAVQSDREILTVS